MEPWRTKDWWGSEYNFRDEIRSKFNLPKTVKFHDATLRDGEQTPGVVFRKEDKIAIAKMLDDIGVDRIEAGMPAVSQEDYDAIKEISKLGLKADIMVFCRGVAADIDKAVECGADGIILEMPSGLPRLKHQFKWTEDEIIEMSVTAAKYAKGKGLKVVFFPYETTRAQLPFLTRMVKRVVEEGGADSVAVIDTLGIALPESVAFLVRTLKGLVDVPIEVHTHNDLGMGVATTLAAVEAGAEVVHVCINGLGERTGNASLAEVAVAIRMLLGIEVSIQFDKLYSLAKETERISGVKLAYGRPLVGDVAFTREIGLGMDMIRTEPTAALPMRPELVGRTFRLVLGKKSGKASIKIKLDELGREATEEQAEELLALVKRTGTENKRYLTEDEWLEIVRRVLG